MSSCDTSSVRRYDDCMYFHKMVLIGAGWLVLCCFVLEWAGQMLLYVVDGAGSEGREPAEELRSLKSELRMYDERMLAKPALVFANKCDLTGTWIIDAVLILDV